MARTALTIGTICALATLAAPAVAQDPGQSQAGLEEIVVTARKREENLQEIPIAITALSAKQIEAAGITRLEDLTLQVAGVQYHPLGLAIPGRVNSSIRFRGMDVNSQVPTFQLGTLFIDGVYVLGGASSIPFDDVERVEVVKGPQSAYFGRNTFGGAINYITKQPSMDRYSGELSATAADYNEYEVSGAFSGPIIPDKLAFRIGGRSYETGGMFKASDGGRLGEESTRSYQVSLKATPIENLSIVARYFFSRDDDGPAAGGAIPGRLNDSCTGRAVSNPAGELVAATRWFCGNVPKIGDAISAIGTRQIIDSNTTLVSQRALVATGDANWLVTNLALRPPPAALIGKLPTIDHIGLKRDVERTSLQAAYQFANGVSLEAQGGRNTLRANWIRDYNFTAFDNAYSRDPQYSKDTSYEFRISSNQEKRLRGLIGANYYEQDFITSGGGGDAAFLCLDNTPGIVIGTCVPSGPGATLLFPNTLGNTDHVETTGYFGALSYDLSDRFTINLEGRWQNDKFVRGLTTFQTLESDTFLPRAILQFKPNERTNLYASYAEGIIQGEINQVVVDADAREQTQFVSLNAPPSVPEELLKSFEIGWKQQFLDNRVVLNSAFYYGDWANKKIRRIVLVNFTCADTPVIANVSPGCRPQLGEASAGQPSRLANGQPSFTSQSVVSPYGVKIWGAEFEARALVNERLELGGELTYARSRMDAGSYDTIGPIAGSTNIKDAANPRFPKVSASVNATYTAPLRGDWTWFARGDATYFGQTFVDLDNLATCRAYTVANARGGVQNDKLRVELFVKNLFDDDNYAACARFLEFDLPADFGGNGNNYQTVIVAPQLKRQLGLRASWKF